MPAATESCVKRYAIVDFIQKSRKKKRSIDLVPSSWIYDYEGQCFCYFPGPGDYGHLPTWLIGLKPYEKTWNDYLVTIISYTDDLDQGYRRLRRAFKQLDVESTDTERNRTNVENNVSIFDEEDINTQLQDVPKMSKANVPGTSTKDSKKKRPKEKSSHNESPAVTLTDPQLIELKNQIDRMLEIKFHNLTLTIEKKIESSKRSILYDIQHKTDGLKNATSGSATSINSIEAKKRGLNGSLPLKTLEEFEDFDKKFRANDEHKESLMLLYKIMTRGEIKIMSTIKKIMEVTMEKTVELEYSGKGRTVNGEGKKSFSDTATYKCLDGVLSDQFADSGELQNLPGKVGRWLSGAGDRGGGRKERTKKN